METMILLPPELQDAVERIAHRSGRASAEVLVEVVRDYVDREGSPRLQSLGVVERAPVESDQIEDWLVANWRPEEAWELGSSVDEFPPRRR